VTGIQMSGLGSGLDTQGIIDQLMQVESQPRIGLQNKQAIASARQTALNDISSKLAMLRTAAQSLGSVSTWLDTQTATSSDTSRIGAVRTSGAAPGGYQVEVSKLATADQHTYAYAAPAADTQLTVNGAPVTLKAGETLDDAVTAINSSDTANVYAINVSGKLVLAAKQTGTANVFTASSADPSVLTEDTSAAKPAIDAQYTVDGVAQPPSGSNVIDNAIPGVQLTLKSLTAGPVTVGVSTPGPDADGIVGQVKSFVSAYNTVVDAIRSRTTEARVVNPQNSSDVVKGSLFGDTGLNDVLGQLRQTLQTTVGTNAAGLQALSDIGISTGAASNSVNQDAVAGKITLDEDKLRAALAKDPGAARRLLGGAAGTTGYAQKLASVLDPLAQTGGVMDLRVKAAQQDVSDINDSLAAFDSRMDDRRALLQKQYAALELALNANSSLMSTVTAGLAKLG
jgi:flagellar hook-associated protein 2